MIPRPPPKPKNGRVLFEQDIIAPEDKPITVTFRAYLPKGRPNIEF
jgi:hypothetical protein